jgi:hypothetical protein
MTGRAAQRRWFRVGIAAVMRALWTRGESKCLKAREPSQSVVGKSFCDETLQLSGFCVGLDLLSQLRASNSSNQVRSLARSSRESSSILCWSCSTSLMGDLFEFQSPADSLAAGRGGEPPGGNLLLPASSCCYEKQPAGGSVLLGLHGQAKPRDERAAGARCRQPTTWSAAVTSGLKSRRWPMTSPSTAMAKPSGVSSGSRGRAGRDRCPAEPPRRGARTRGSEGAVGSGRAGKRS